MATMIDSAFFGDLYSTAEMREVWSDPAMIQRWLDVEAALARAQARLGIIPRRRPPRSPTGRASSSWTSAR